MTEFVSVHLLPDRALDVTLSLLAVGAPALLLAVTSLPGVGLAGPPRRLVYRLHRGRVKIWAVALGGWLVLTLRSVFGAVPTVWPLATGVGLAGLAAIYALGYPSRLFRILDRPRFWAADEVSLPDATRVIGIAGGEGLGPPRAYTLDTLIQPHAAVDTLGEKPMLVTWCTLSGSGCLWPTGPGLGSLDRLHPLTAINDNICFLDDATGNLIQQIEERVVCGPDTGLRFERHPATVTSWKTWRELYPTTRVCHMPPGRWIDRPIRRWMLAIEAGMGSRTRPFHRVDRPLDPRLPAMTPVLGIARDGVACAWPCSRLYDVGVLEAEVGATPVVLLADRTRGIAAAHLRRVETVEGDHEPPRPLDLIALDAASDPASELSAGEPAVARSGDGSRWDVAGRCVCGPLHGSRLAAVPHLQGVYWFAWALAHPDTRLDLGAEPGGGTVPSPLDPASVATATSR